MKFQSFTNFAPVKFTINYKQRKIIGVFYYIYYIQLCLLYTFSDFDCSELLTQIEISDLECNGGVLENVPEFLARIRQHLVKNT